MTEDYGVQYVVLPSSVRVAMYKIVRSNPINQKPSQLSLDLWLVPTEHVHFRYQTYPGKLTTTEEERNQLQDDSPCHLEQDSVREKVKPNVISEHSDARVPAFLIASSLDIVLHYIAGDIAEQIGFTLKLLYVCQCKEQFINIYALNSGALDQAVLYN